jgi:predicted amidohydrolase YtcJ
MAGSDGGRDGSGLSRRGLVKGALFAAGSSVLGGGAAASAASADPGPVAKRSPIRDSSDLALVNGRILTFDDSDTVASALAIRDGRIVEVGRRVGRCSQTIDLRGATVIPGLIDASTRYTRTAAEPGHHARLIETARSIGDVQRMLADRAKTVPAGEFITCISGWGHNAFNENRLPTPAELDRAAPRHPVFLAENYFGPADLAVANTKGIAFFASHGVSVDQATGRLDMMEGIAALRAVQTPEDRLQSTADGMTFAASLGMTMINDFGDSGAADTLEASFQHVVELWRQGRLDLRLRLRVRPAQAGYQQRILANINRLGDDVLRLNGSSDVASGDDPNGPPPVADTIAPFTFVAANGWSQSVQALSLPENQVFAAGIQAANAQHPLRDLRWSLAHVNNITADIAKAMADIGVGVTPSGWQFPYDDNIPGSSYYPYGPPWRTLLDTPGLRVGAGTDAAHSGPFNPWLNMYYMTTGRNNAGHVVLTGQKISRLEALRIYTKGSAWHTFDEHHLGTIEPGKLADLAVLNADPLTVSDDRLRTMGSSLTLQAGRIVYQAGR